MAESGIHASAGPPSPSAVPSHDRWVLARCLDDCAKWWWGVSLTLKLAGFVVGVAAIVLPLPAKAMPFALAAMAILSELCLYRSDGIKATAQGLRRKLDLLDGFGWEISNAEYSDLLARSPASVKKRTCGRPLSEPYFASTQQPGPTRALQNVSESGWWSKHLSEEMGQLCLVGLVGGVLGSVTLLIVAIHAITDRDALSAAARVVTTVLTLLLSVGLVKLMIGYYGFSKKAARSEEAAERLLESRDTGQDDALKIVTEYHIARAGAPIIPTWLWKLRQAELSRLWEEYRATRS